MEENKDFITMEDDSGATVSLYIIGYFSYEGTEYAILSEDEEGLAERYVMMIRAIPGDDENEEFIPVEDALAEEVLAAYESCGEETDDDL